MKNKVVIYTKPGCPFSKAAKQDLRKRGVEYEEIDISENPQAEEQVLKLAGKKAVPVIVEGEKVTVGFNGM